MSIIEKPNLTFSVQGIANSITSSINQAMQAVESYDANSTAAKNANLTNVLQQKGTNSIYKPNISDNWLKDYNDKVKSTLTTVVENAANISNINTAQEKTYHGYTESQIQELLKNPYTSGYANTLLAMDWADKNIMPVINDLGNSMNQMATEFSSIRSFDDFVKFTDHCKATVTTGVVSTFEGITKWFENVGDCVSTWQLSYDELTLKYNYPEYYKSDADVKSYVEWKKKDIANDWTGQQFENLWESQTGQEINNNSYVKYNSLTYNANKALTQTAMYVAASLNPATWGVSAMSAGGAEAEITLQNGGSVQEASTAAFKGAALDMGLNVVGFKGLVPAFKTAAGTIKNGVAKGFSQVSSSVQKVTSLLPDFGTVASKTKATVGNYVSGVGRKLTDANAYAISPGINALGNVTKGLGIKVKGIFGKGGKTSSILNESGLIDARKLPLSEDPVTRSAQQKIINGEPLTTAEKIKLGRDEVTTKIGDYELKSDCAYRVIDSKALDEYATTGRIYRDIDEYVPGKNNGGIDWYLGGTATKYGNIILECPAKPDYFSFALDYGNGMAKNPLVRHIKSSSKENTIPFEEVTRVIIVDPKDKTKVIKVMTSSEAIQAAKQASNSALFNIKRFFGIDTETKEILYSMGSPAKYTDPKSMFVDPMKYSDNLWKGMSRVKSRLLEICDMYDIDSSVVKKIESCFAKYEQRLMSSTYTYSDLEKIYDDCFGKIDQKTLELVHRKLQGATYWDSSVLKGLITDSSSANEILHILHSYVLNSESIMKSIETISSHELKSTGRLISLRGSKNPVADEIYTKIIRDNEKIPDSLRSICVGNTDIISVSNDQILIMVRDKGHCTTIDCRLEQSGEWSASYFVPKPISDEKILKLRGLEHYKAGDEYATGSFVSSGKNFSDDVVKLINDIPTDAHLAWHGEKLPTVSEFLEGAKNGVFSRESAVMNQALKIEYLKANNASINEIQQLEKALLDDTGLTQSFQIVEYFGAQNGASDYVNRVIQLYDSYGWDYAEKGIPKTEGINPREVFQKYSANELKILYRISQNRSWKF